MKTLREYWLLWLLRWFGYDPKHKRDALTFPVGSSFAEYNGDIYVAHKDFGVVRVVVNAANDLDWETIPRP